MRCISYRKARCYPYPVSGSYQFRSRKAYDCHDKECERAVGKASVGKEQSGKERYEFVTPAYGTSFHIYVREEGSEPGRREDSSLLKQNMIHVYVSGPYSNKGSNRGEGKPTRNMSLSYHNYISFRGVFDEYIIIYHRD